VARARIQEGNTSGAEEMLRPRSRSIQLGEDHFFLGTALKSLGKYDERWRTCARPPPPYPRDRRRLQPGGRVLFLQRKYAEAITEFKRVLASNPEDCRRTTT